MVWLNEDAAEGGSAAGLFRGWLWPAISGRMIGKSDSFSSDHSGRGPPSPLQASEEEAERAFDIADAMECGLARELVTDFVQPLKRSRTLWKFKVVRSDDRLQYRLFSDDGNGGGSFLMYARCRLEASLVEFHLYDPGCDDSGLFDSERPAFTMSWNQTRTEWHLVQHRAEKREVAFIQHTRRSVGSGVNYCMDVVLPPPDNSKNSKETVLSTKLPEWNEGVGSLVLDFKGRRISASAKNFQLAPTDRKEHVTCQFGKIGPDVFGLDFRYPLTVIQAFGMAMSTVHWT